MSSTVIFNVPNSVGYLRIALLILSVFSSDLTFVMLYGLSSVLDFFDGYFARMFDQCTMLGSCLDMITDRVSTVVISLRIIQRKDGFSSFLALYIIFDLVSHFIYFLMSALVGRHHKKTNNTVLRIYYDKRVLGPICLLSELFFVYTYYFDSRGWVSHFLTAVAMAKMIFHVAQLFEAVSGVSKIMPEVTK